MTHPNREEWIIFMQRELRETKAKFRTIKFDSDEWYRLRGEMERLGREIATYRMCS